MSQASLPTRRSRQRPHFRPAGELARVDGRQRRGLAEGASALHRSVQIGSTLLNHKRQMRSGSFDTPPPPEDKPEEMKAWREAHGVPAEESATKSAMM